MAKRRKKAAPKRTRRTKRASYKVRSTKAGARRYGARRAYAPVVRRRARRNPKGPLGSPAVQYSLAASAGFLAASYADTSPMLNPVNDDGTAKLPFGLKGSVLAGAITLAAAEFLVRGRNKQYLRAAAVGMFAPSVINMVQTAWAAQSNGNTSGGAYHLQARPISRLAAPRGAARGFATASRNLDNVAA